MMPPYVDGCRPEAGSVLQENVIRLYGNCFNYISVAPAVLSLPAGTRVEIDWRYRYEVHHVPEGQTGGGMPSEMQIWISHLKPGERYRLEYHDFAAEFTAGDEIRYQWPPREAKPPGWFRALLNRLGLSGR